jgi:hypothetical protein
MVLSAQNLLLADFLQHGQITAAGNEDRRRQHYKEVR